MTAIQLLLAQFTVTHVDALKAVSDCGCLLLTPGVSCMQLSSGFFAKTSINSLQNFWELLGNLSHSAFIPQLPLFESEPHRNSKTLHSQFLPRSPASLSTEGYWRLDGAHRCIERHFLDFVSLFLSTEEVTLFCS